MKLRNATGRIPPFEVVSTEPKLSESCQECGKLLDVVRSDTCYCSVKCKQKAWRKRNKLEVTDKGSVTASRNAEASDGSLKAD